MRGRVRGRGNFPVDRLESFPLQNDVGEVMRGRVMMRWMSEGR